VPVNGDRSVLADRQRRLAAAAALGAVVVIGQLIAGLAASSVGLLADAGHNLVDLLGLALAVGSVRLAQRAPTARRSYGFHRATILSALANATVVVAVGAAIVVGAALRLAQPHPVAGGVMLGTALGAGGVNLWAAELVRGHAGDLNVRGARLHLLGDAGAALAVALAGLLILSTGGNTWLDPAASLLVAALIGWQGIRLAGASVSVLLESTPAGLQTAAVSDEISGVPGVAGVHDLHVWALSSELRALSGHLVLAGDPSLAEAQAIAEQVKVRLRERLAIAHATLEVERDPCLPADPCALDPARGGTAL
jgi:cobalt-zinc-cadmium efflux system protein